jgi:flagellar hook-associated protein 1 FlgK
MADARASALQDLEGRLTGEGTDVAQAIGNFFGAAGALAASPMDESLRQAIVAAAQKLAGTLSQSQEAVARQTADANQRIADYAQQASQLAQTIADANKTLATSNDPVVADKRDLAAKQLADLTGGQARVDSDGQMRFVIGSGTVLVDGQHANTLRVNADPTDPTKVKVQVVDGVHTDDVTTTLDGGRIAGELDFGGTAAKTGADIDQLAYDLATHVNALTSAAKAPDGTTGHALFVAPTGVAGAAMGFAVDPTIAANPDLVPTAAAGEGSAGNGGINALLALRDQKLAGGGTRTFVDEGIRALGAIGSATASAVASQSTASANMSMVAALRDSLSGVSQEDQLAKLAAFQHASDAAAKFVSTVDAMLTNLITTV